MAPQTQHNRPLPRRTFLNGALAQLRKEYLERVEDIAERFRRRFVAGELRGWRDGDAGESFERHDQAPLNILEEELLAEVKGSADAYAILLCSPSETLVDGAIALEDANAAAAQALARDVLRVARRRRWYVPARGETPTSRELGIN